MIAGTHPGHLRGQYDRALLVAQYFTYVKLHATIVSMIRSFRHKGLAEFFAQGNARGIKRDLAKRCQRRLNALHTAQRIEDLNIPGFSLHLLCGSPTRYAIRVSGPWQITLEWREDGAWRVDLEQYH